MAMMAILLKCIYFKSRIASYFFSRCKIMLKETVFTGKKYIRGK